LLAQAHLQPFLCIRCDPTFVRAMAIDKEGHEYENVGRNND